MTEGPDEHLLNPDAAPWKAVHRVRRLNQRPWILIGTGLILFVIAIVTAAVERSNALNTPISSSPQAISIDVSRPPEFVPPLQHALGTIIQPAAPEEPTTGLSLSDSEESPPSAAPDAPEPAEGAAPTLRPPGAPTPNRNDLANDAQRLLTPEEVEELRKEKLALAKQALRSAGTIDLPTPQPQTPSAPQDALEELRNARQQLEALEQTGAGAVDANAIAAQVQQLQNGLGMAPGVAARGAPGAPVPGPNDLRAFELPTDSGDPWRLEAEVETPRSRYILQAGEVIPASLVTAINSGLPGTIVAMVTRAVYDSPTGRFPLVPPGTELLGAYSADVGYGQERIFFAWRRMRFPDGRTINIGAMPGADALGRAGGSDIVNNHLLRMFAGALMMSVVTAGIGMTQQSISGRNHDTFDSQLSSALGQNIGQVALGFLQRQMNVAPELELREGFLFNVVCTKDIVFPGAYRHLPPR